MTCTDMTDGIGATMYGYASHSFNQIVRIDDGKMVSVDHGDAYPRCMALADTKTGEQYSLLEIAGETGDNSTGAALGDFQVSDSSYLICGKSVDQDKAKKNNDLLYKGKQNIYLSIMDKKTKKVKLKWITAYKNSENLYNPYLTKITSNRFMLIWKNKKTLYVQEVNGDGELIGKKKSYKGYDLTCCEPVYANGKIQWYKTKNKKVHFYYLNCTEQLRELSQPKISTFEKEQNGIRIWWEKCKYADGYCLYKKNKDGKFSKIGEFEGTLTYLDIPELKCIGMR